jgi:predicted nucleotidyltransferase
MTDIKLKTQVESLLPSGGKLFYLLECGSRAYGTSTSDSDRDLRGVYSTGLRGMIEGFRSDRVITAQLSDDTELVLQPLHAFIRLCMAGNPNILDWLFVPEEMHEFVDDEFRTKVLDERMLFLSLRIYRKFRGYAKNHFQRMERGTTRELGEKRKKDIEKFGYSTKNAMHLIRLARVGCEALETGEYNVRRPDADELLAIRRGEWALKEIKAEGDRLLARMDKAAEMSPLSPGVPMERARELVVELVLNMSMEG